MKQGKGLREQGILLLHANRPNVADLPIVQVWLNLVPKVGGILHDAGNLQAAVRCAVPARIAR